MKVIKKKQKVGIILILFVILFSFIPFTGTTLSYDPEAPIIRLGPYLQNVSGNTITVCWTTNENNSGDNTVEFGENTGVYTHNETATTVDTNTSFWGAIGGWTKSYDYFGEFKHEAQLTSIWDTFYYRVNSSGVYSDEYYYTLPGDVEESGNNVNFIILGDTQPDTQTRNEYVKLCFDDIAAREHDVDLLVQMGDIVGYPYYEEIWGNMSHQMAHLSQQLNSMLVATVGCHEYTEKQYTQLNGYRDYFSPPPNNYEGLRDWGNNPNNKQWYSFDYKQIHFVSVNIIGWRDENCSSGDFPGCQCLPNYTVGSDLYNWLESDLENASNNPDTCFIIVYSHTSPYRVQKESVCCTGPVYEWTNSFGHLFDTYGVDIHFQGHDHFFLRTKRIYDNYTVESEPEDNGTTYYTATALGCNWQPKGGVPDGAPSDLEDFYATGTGNRADPADWPSNWGYIRCNASDGNLTVKAIRYNTGAILDTFTLNKTFSPQASTPQFISIDGGSNGTTIYDSTPTFIWSNVTNAEYYQLQIATDSGFSNIVSNINNINEIVYPSEYSEGTNVNFILPNSYALPSYNTYYCRVKAYKED